MRGGAAPRKPSGHSCWRGMKGDHWSDRALERFTAAIEQARSEGYRGRQALSRAHAILWPKPATVAIDAAITEDDVEFVERCVLAIFETGDPVYLVGVNYYTTRKKNLRHNTGNTAGGAMVNRQRGPEKSALVS